MNEPNLVIQRSEQGTVARLIRRRITGEDADVALWNDLGALITAGETSPIVLDFSHVQYVSSAALEGLLTLAKKCKAARYDLRLSGLCPSIHEVMELMQLDRALKIYSSVAAALED
jgi:anti-sigma B factor antagonist